MLKTLVEHWPYNPANRGYILVHKPNPHSSSTQVFTSFYHHYPPGPGIFPYPPVGVELSWTASPHKGKGSPERSVARAIGIGCFCCCFSSFCLTVGLCSRPARHIALHYVVHWHALFISGAPARPPVHADTTRARAAPPRVHVYQSPRVTGPLRPWVLGSTPTCNDCHTSPRGVSPTTAAVLI